MENKPATLLYCNNGVKNAELEDFQNKYCCLILDNGFFYVGTLLIEYEDKVVFIDRKLGRQKFNKERIFVVYEKHVGEKQNVEEPEKVKETETKKEEKEVDLTKNITPYKEFKGKSTDEKDW